MIGLVQTGYSYIWKKMIERLLYNQQQSQREIFHFYEMTTLEVTSLLDDTTKINSVKIVAYDKNDYLGEDVFENFKRIKDLNSYFVNNRRYYLHDCELNLEDGMKP
jgi:hypothetical protein